MIDRSDLGLAPADLPPEMADALTDDWRSLIGQETTVGVGENQLLGPASVAEPGSSDGPARRVSLELSRAGAIDGNLESGGAVDLASSSQGERGRRACPRGRSADAPPTTLAEPARSRCSISVR